MGLFDFLHAPDINDGVDQFQNTKNAVLLDVRTKEEYAQGHIPGSKNLPLQEIGNAEAQIKDKNTPIFVYCLSGGRSGQARRQLLKMGYEHVTNIGGISAYRGRREP